MTAPSSGLNSGANNGLSKHLANKSIERSLEKVNAQINASVNNPMGLPPRVQNQKDPSQGKMLDLNLLKSIQNPTTFLRRNFSTNQFKGLNEHEENSRNKLNSQKSIPVMPRGDELKAQGDPSLFRSTEETLQILATMKETNCSLKNPNSGVIDRRPSLPASRESLEKPVQSSKNQQFLKNFTKRSTNPFSRTFSRAKLEKAESSKAPFNSKQILNAIKQQIKGKGQGSKFSNITLNGNAITPKNQMFKHFEQQDRSVEKGNP